MDFAKSASAGLLAVVACVGPALLVCSACKKASDEPFHWVGTGQVQLKMPMSPCSITTPDGAVQGEIVVGSGTISGQHIGQDATLISSECASKTSPYFSGGLMTITAQNGDAIHINYHGKCGQESPALLTCQEVDEIAGGTGRFADASGSATGALKAHFTYDSAGNLIMPWSVDLDYTGTGSF